MPSVKRALYSASPKKTNPPEVSPVSSSAQTVTAIREFIRKHERPVLISGGVMLAIAAVLLFAALQPKPDIVSRDEINEALAKTIETITSLPSDEAYAYSVIAPSVVRVSRYAEDEQGESAVGTGVVIDEAGIILTSLHVVTGPDRITVTFIDGFETNAQIVSAQPEDDIAALQVEVTPEGLVPATLTSTRGLRSGDTVVVVGNPFGIGNSVSAGIVSGLNRTYAAEDDGNSFTGLIQFDAAANPGNSGGPLVNRNGEVLGIVSAILNPTDLGVFIGIGFAVPIEQAARAGGPNPF